MRHRHWTLVLWMYIGLWSINIYESSSIETCFGASIKENIQEKESNKTISPKKKKKEVDIGDEESDEYGEYGEYDEYDEYDESDGSDSEEDENNIDSDSKPKNLVNQALLQSRKSSKYLLKNKTKVMILVSIVAFRKELSTILRLYRPNIHPSTVLKSVLFLDMLRTLYTKNSGSKNGMTSLFRDMRHGSVYGGIHNAPTTQHFMFESLNHRYGKDFLALQKIQQLKSELGSKKEDTSLLSNTTMEKGKTLVITFDLQGDVQMTQLQQLRETVSFLLSIADSLNATNHISSNSTLTNATSANNITQSQIEVIVVLESSGGALSPYGLASSQLKRLREYSQNENFIQLTICVDKVAASGGYLIACQASPNSLLAAPFAFIGSIGVVSQTVNFHSTLKQWGVKPLVFKAPGEGKAPIGAFAPVTKEGMEFVQAMVESSHDVFKKTILEGRGDILKEKLDQVATGEVWLGEKALEFGLIDRLMTSDEYIQERMRSGLQVLKLHRCERSRFNPFFGLSGRSSSPFTIFKFIQKSVHEMASYHPI